MKKTKMKKNVKKPSLIERFIYSIALLFVFILPFSLLYIESKKMEIADQTEQTKMEIGKEQTETSKHEVQLNNVSSTTQKNENKKNNA